MDSVSASRKRSLWQTPITTGYRWPFLLALHTIRTGSIFRCNCVSGVWEKRNFPLSVWYSWQGGGTALVPTQGKNDLVNFSKLLHADIQCDSLRWFYRVPNHNSMHSHSKLNKGGSDEKLWKVRGVRPRQREIQDADIHQAWTLCQVHLTNIPRSSWMININTLKNIFFETPPLHRKIAIRYIDIVAGLAITR